MDRVRRDAVVLPLLARFSWRVAVLLLVALPVLAAPPYKYYVLAPEPLTADLAVTSLEPANTVSVSGTQRTLAAYETALIPAASLFPGAIITGTAQYTVGSNAAAADLLAPDFFAGTEFVIPHITGNHRYFVQATGTTANLTIRQGATTSTLQVNPGTAYEIDAGSDNGIAGRISSDQPVVVAHVAYVSGVARDAYPVPPASTEIIGIRSQQAVVGAVADGTSVTAYASDGTSASYSLDAGQKVLVDIGASTAQGGGSSLRIVANQPIAAVQYDDGDGADAGGFWPVSALRYRYVLPVNAQYVALACMQAAVTVTLFKGASSPESQTCSGSGGNPGKVYFGSATSGANVLAESYLQASAPIYVMYEAAATEEEHNLSGAQTAAGPSAPTLNSVLSPTTSNPITVTGTANANATVRLYVNGKLQQTATATGTGGFTFSAELYDGNNVVHAVVVNGGDESTPSNVVEVVYNNTISRTPSGTISTNQVWTPGSPATPYVISSTLTIATGAKLVLQPGTTLMFASGASLTVNGLLKISGTSGSPVSLTSSAASPGRGSWSGVLFNSTSTGSEINNALIEWAVNGVNVSGVAVTVRNSTIRNFSGTGIYLSGAGANGALVENNLIDNLNDQKTCVMAAGSSPTIRNNTVRNCVYGVYAQGSASPTVTGNIVTGNIIGVYVDGSFNGSVTPQPVVTGNQILGNTTNFAAEAYGNAVNVVLNATGNWWGSADPTAISGSISDVSDNVSNPTNFPVVDYSGYLSSAGGPPVSGSFLIGPLTATSTTLTAGTAYDVLGVVTVGSGKTLTIAAGATLRFHGNAYLIVNGTLNVQGTSSSPVTFTSGRASPGRGNWPGIQLSASGSTIDYALIEWAVTGVSIGVTATVRNSTIRNFSSYGIYLGGAGANGALVENNLVDNLNAQKTCIMAAGSAPTIRNNTVRNCVYGVYAQGAGSPTVTGNVVTSNIVGVYVDGSFNGSVTPRPVVTGNQIFGNTTNFAAEAYSNAVNLVLNARGNWWGSTVPTSISASISDFNDNYSNPTNFPAVDYSDYLDGPGGNPVPGNYLIGPLTAATTTLTTGATYDVLGHLFVMLGKTLIVPEGVTLRFHAGSFLTVDGTLNISGTASSGVLLTSGKATPANDDWRGIYVRNTASGVTIDYATIEWTTRAIETISVNAIITHSTIRRFSGIGILMSGAGTSSRIANNLIDNVTQIGDGINLSSSSPTITENRIHRTNRGISLSGASNPVITRNLLQNNKTGLFLFGNNSNSAAAVPQPTINQNDLFGNTIVQMEVSAYGATNPAVINATGNWWGTPSPVMGAQITATNGTVASAVNFSSPATGTLTDDMGSPTPPTTISATANSDTQITVSWSGATDDFGIVSYGVERCIGVGCTDFTQIASVTTTSFVDPGRIASTPYSYRVRAFDAVPHASLYSSTAVATTLIDGAAPGAPSSLDVVGVSGHQVHLVWTPATDNMGIAVYLIERCQGSSCSNFTLIGTSRRPSFWSSGLTVSSAYNFRVRAQDRAANFSPYSNVKSATTTAGGEDCD